MCNCRNSEVKEKLTNIHLNYSDNYKCNNNTSYKVPFLDVIIPVYLLCTPITEKIPITGITFNYSDVAEQC